MSTCSEDNQDRNFVTKIPLSDKFCSLCVEVGGILHKARNNFLTSGHFWWCASYEPKHFCKALFSVLGFLVWIAFLHRFPIVCFILETHLRLSIIITFVNARHRLADLTLDEPLRWVGSKFLKFKFWFLLERVRSCWQFAQSILVEKVQGKTAEHSVASFVHFVIRTRWRWTRCLNSLVSRLYESSRDYKIAVLKSLQLKMRCNLQLCSEFYRFFEWNIS
jgi:hypothetical protein